MVAVTNFSRNYAVESKFVKRHLNTFLTLSDEKLSEQIREVNITRIKRNEKRYGNYNWQGKLTINGGLSKLTVSG